VIPLLLNVLCYSLQTLLSLTTLANPSVYIPQRTSSIIQTFGLFILSAYLSIGRMPLITSSLFLTFYLTLLSTLLQTRNLYLILYFPIILWCTCRLKHLLFYFIFLNLIFLFFSFSLFWTIKRSVTTFT